MVRQVDLHTFFTSTCDWQWVSHTQTEGWVSAFLQSADIRCFVSEQIACIGWLSRKWGRTMLTITGEFFRSLPVTEKQVFAFFEQVARTDADIIYVNSDSLYSPLYEAGIRQAGFLRPVGMFSTTLSKEIPLERPYVFDKSWQRNLQKADEAQLRFVPVAAPSEEVLADYVRLHGEMERRKGFRDGLTAEQLRAILSHPEFRLAWVDDREDRHLAGGIVFCRGDYARFLYSFTTDEGRQMSASYFLYKGLMDALAADGVKRFDLGRLSPSKSQKNNLFLFKNGIDGTTVSYNGEWLYTTSRWLPFALCLANKYYWKRVQV
ncbi:MAG: GNAT family N-acetyltransferase [Paludibacteraceae bacterium]|nr:GNAT family N-acetyltransferase [Paludibacteraceae bacterium]